MALPAGPASAVKIVDGVHWIGSLDPLRTVFDIIMPLDHGTTYNAYVVRGTQKTAVIEASKHIPQMEYQLLTRLGSVVDPAKVDYIVLNHMEPDHSGALNALMEAAPNARVVVSKSGEHFVRNLLNRDVKPLTVGDGDSLDLGGKTLRFISAPFLHWPDTMFTYLPEDRILFSCDFMGSHYCDDRIFSDLVDDFSFYLHYYFDSIIRPYKEYVLKALDKIRPLAIDIICPSHGPVLRDRLSYYYDHYAEWSKAPDPNRRRRAVVAYASAYGNTTRMARAVANGLAEKGLAIEVIDIGLGIPQGLVEIIEASDALVVGSPTFVGDALKPVWTLLGDFATIKVKGKVAAAFGSFGWSGEAVGLLQERLKGMKMKVVEPGVRATLTPTDEDLESCRDLGRRVADAVLA